MNALRIYTTVSKTRNVSMRMVHFIVIVILGILKTATAAKLIGRKSTLIPLVQSAFKLNLMLIQMGYLKSKKEDSSTPLNSFTSEGELAAAGESHAPTGDAHTVRMAIRL